VLFGAPYTLTQDSKVFLVESGRVYKYSGGELQMFVNQPLQDCYLLLFKANFPHRYWGVFGQFPIAS